MTLINGDSYESALSDVKPAIRFHLDSFGREVVESDASVLEAFIAKTGVAV